MFYSLLGRLVWRFGVTYVRRRYGRPIVVAAVLLVASAVGLSWLASRPVREG